MHLVCSACHFEIGRNNFEGLLHELAGHLTTVERLTPDLSRFFVEFIAESQPIPFASNLSRKETP